MPNTEVFITARFTEMEKFKTTWLNYDGTVFRTKYFYIDEEPYMNDIPTKPADNQYTYEFSGWDKGTKTGNGNDMEFKPSFTPISRKPYMLPG